MRAQRNDEILELIPHQHLLHDFPAHLVSQFVHWLHVDTGEIEWRPLSDAWTPINDCWRLRPKLQGWRLERLETQLIDVRSPTAQAIADLFSGIETASNLEITLSSDFRDINIRLPRLSLQFQTYCQDREIYSKQFPGFMLDSTQQCGALSGLKNKLILRSQNNLRRQILIPFGSVSTTVLTSHTQVFVDLDSDRPSYLLYTINRPIGRLVGNGTMISRLYLCYLHAVTTSCFVDNLTGMTGTEQALVMLKEGAIQTFTNLEHNELTILQRISALSPRREYYPPHLHIMQQITWSNQLPVLAQHHAFHEQVSHILEHQQLAHMFHPVSCSTELHFPSFPTELVQRAAIRDAVFRVNDFDVKKIDTGLNKFYHARSDGNTAVAEAYEVFNVCRLIENGSVSCDVPSDLLASFRALGYPLKGASEDETWGLFNSPELIRQPIKQLAESWCSLLLRFSQGYAQDHKYETMWLTSVLAYTGSLDMNLIQALIAFATVPSLQQLGVPSGLWFDLSQGTSPKSNALRHQLRAAGHGFLLCTDTSLPTIPSKKRKAATKLRKAQYEANLDRYANLCTTWLLEQGPVFAASEAAKDEHIHKYIALDRAMAGVNSLFQTCSWNENFENWAQSAQLVLQTIHGSQRYVRQPRLCVKDEFRLHRHPSFTWRTMLASKAPVIPPFQHEWPTQLLAPGSVTDELRKVGSLIDELKDSSDTLRERYTQDLQCSIRALQSHNGKDSVIVNGQNLAHWLDHFVATAKAHYTAARNQIFEALQAHLPFGQSLAWMTEMAPRTGEFHFLQLLNHNHRQYLPADWREAFVAYGISITTLQKAVRLHDHQIASPEFADEVVLAGHQNWSASEYPDWLLIELENDLLIRPNQVETAMEMISSGSSQNSILQLNMGEGKSSVIMPMVAATLADRTRLVRVVVLKQLFKPMTYILTNRLGGLLSRRISSIPFSRSLVLDVQDLAKLLRTFQSNMESGDIWLAQPEHILSFDLYGPDHVLRSQDDIGRIAIKLHHWTLRHTRDILDESDEVLNPKYELIYTVGGQKPVDSGAHRWSLIVEILFVVIEIALQKEVLQQPQQAPWTVPALSFPSTEAIQSVLDMSRERILNDGLPNFPLHSVQQSQRNSFRSFLCEVEPSSHVLDDVRQISGADQRLWQSLLILRGLFIEGVLLFVLDRHRWRVTFGLSRVRSLLAVPFRAKDTPSPRSEFSHPDITIILTFLSYFYEGITATELRKCFHTLGRSDNAVDAYRGWISNHSEDTNVPRHLAGVNLDDDVQWLNCVYDNLRLSRGVINFHLSHHVFPQALREYPHKLSSSGWNLVRQKPNQPTTGFSGTNDGRFLLPTSIKQNDMVAQKHTNAMVLAHLLRSENSVHTIDWSRVVDGSKSKSILQWISDQEHQIHVLVDVGAQMLEMTNHMVAKEWLLRLSQHSADAAVFFNEDDVVMVLDRNGQTEPLAISPFAAMLHRCVFYLDDVHTRGTDFKFPRSFRAAVTLSCNMTKDRLVQGMFCN